MKLKLNILFLLVLSGCGSPVSVVKSIPETKVISDNKQTLIQRNQNSLPVNDDKFISEDKNTEQLNNKEVKVPLEKQLVILKPSISKSNGNTCSPCPDELVKDNSTNNSQNNNSSFDIARDVKEGIRNTYITLIFKDESKVRLDFNSFKFKSLVNQNVDDINNLVEKNNIRIEYLDSIVGQSEESLENQHILDQQSNGKDFPNKASIYYLTAENINVKEFIKKLRSQSTVLSANETIG